MSHTISCLITAVMISLALPGCSALFVKHLARDDFQTPDSALSVAKEHAGELRKILSVSRSFDSLRRDRKARKEMARILISLFASTNFNGAVLRFWEYSSGNIDSCDDGWNSHSRVIVGPKVDTERKRFSRLPFGRYRISGDQGEPPLYLSRGIALVEGERRYEYCYDIEDGKNSDVWMRFYFLGGHVTGEGQNN